VTCRSCKSRRNKMRLWVLRKLGIIDMYAMQSKKIRCSNSKITSVIETGAKLEGSLRSMDEVIGAAIAKLSAHDDDLSGRLDANRNALQKIKSDIRELVDVNKRIDETLMVICARLDRVERPEIPSITG